MPAKPNNRKAWKALLAQVEKDATAQFPDDSGKLAQLHATLATAAMVIDNLHDYPPYVLPTI